MKAEDKLKAHEAKLEGETQDSTKALANANKAVKAAKEALEKAHADTAAAESSAKEAKAKEADAVK